MFLLAPPITKCPQISFRISPCLEALNCGKLAQIYLDSLQTHSMGRSCQSSLNAMMTHMGDIAGGKYVYFCAWVQYIKLGVMGIGYTITAGLSMV